MFFSAYRFGEDRGRIYRVVRSDLPARKVLRLADLSAQQLVSIQRAVEDIHASDNLIDYLQRLVAHTRESADFAYGVSPRGALSLLRSAKTWAMMSGRGHVVPEDIQLVLPAVLDHRISSSLDYRSDGHALSQKLLQEVDVIG